jgi:hypothetical protein
MTAKANTVTQGPDTPGPWAMALVQIIGTVVAVIIGGWTIATQNQLRAEETAKSLARIEEGVRAQSTRLDGIEERLFRLESTKVK